MTVRAVVAPLGAALLVVSLVLPASASPVVVLERVLVADASAVSFAVRPTYDAGGASPLHFYMGYADANVTTPAPSADGQASWYNLNIVETAAFQPPENCTTDKNAQATRDGVADVHAWAVDYVQSVATSIAGQEQPSPPTIPGPRHACTERFPGFAQSRYPATHSIDEAAEDTYLDKPSAAWACREQPDSSQCAAYRQHWPAFRAVSGRLIRDGSFSARATDAPAQRSEALLFGVGDGVVVSVGVARSTAIARLDGETLTTEATTELNDVCVMATTSGCTVRIDAVRQVARIRSEPGKRPVVEAGTVVVGLHASGVARDVSAQELRLHQLGVDLGGYFTLDGVSTTGTCDPGEPDPSIVVADAGGLRLGGSGGAGRQGGSITIGGACVRAQIDAVTIERAPDGDAGVPPQLPGPFAPPFASPPADVPSPGAPAFGAPQIVTREVVRVTYRDPIAWRTAPYWGTTLGVLALLGALGYAFRRSRFVAPVARTFDGFARQFLRG